jgi:hypothetical protein
MRQHPQRTIVPALAALTAIRVAQRIHDAVDRPHGAQRRRRNRELETGNRHGAERGRVVLVEVLVRTLRRVEGEHGLGGRRGCGLDLLVRGVFEGVRDFGGLAERANAAAVPGTDDEGGDGGEEDVAVV